MRTLEEQAQRRRSKRAARRRRARRGERGVALLLVLISVTLLTILAQSAREDVLIYANAAAVARDQVIAEYQARSIVNLSRVILHAEPTIRRGLTPILAPMMALMGRGLAVPQIPVWEQADLLIGPFRNNDGERTFNRTAGVEMGSSRNLGVLTGADAPLIIDEDSRINVNGLDRSSVIERRVAQQLVGLLANPRLDMLFSDRDPDGQYTDRLALVGALVDYGDGDINQFDTQSLLATNQGASAGAASEDSFYTNLHPPYMRRNAPFDSVEELRMVRGMNNDDVWSAIVDPDPGNPRRRTLTVWGQGLVNVNTANAQTLLALICAFSPASTQCTDASAASQFISSVTLLQAFTVGMGIPLFTTPHQFVDTISGRPPMGPMLTSLGMQPFTLADGGALERAVTTESKVFSIYAESNVGQAHVRIHAVVDMRAQPPVPLMFQQAMNTGIGGRAATADVAQVQTAGGNIATVSSAGGTVVYWRED